MYYPNPYWVGVGVFVLFMLVILIGLAVLLVSMSRRPSSHVRMFEHETETRSVEDDAAVRIARERYARGEIGDAEYDAILGRLRGTWQPPGTGPRPTPTA